ncbi:McrC family protein [Paenisporosarcina quisquiliarum]|uniref:McrC family protein n=1 Tax=Paenisporosarcina quisquiliarum TaxID=365346 RepID=UPI0037359BA9
MKDEIKIQEYNERLIMGYECSEIDRSYLRHYATIHKNTPWEQRFYFDELKDGLRIRTTSFVGLIELERLRIIIQPKFDDTFTEVINMALFANGRPFWSEVETRGSMEKSELFRMLISKFLNETENLLKKGLKKDYVEHSGNLKQVRGKVSLRKNALHNYNLPNNIYCEFDELTQDIVENQLILKVLTLLDKLPLESYLKHRIYMLQIQFSSICVPYEERKWPELSYNRLNDNYRVVHTFGRFIFEKLFLQNYTASDNNHFAFLVDMNELFERFVGAVLKRYLPPHFRVTEGQRITNAVLLDGLRYRDVIPDIIVRDERLERTYVIDTKYKAYDFKKVITSDIFQLAFYAQYFQKADIYKATIVYPVFKGIEHITSNKIELNKHAVHSGCLFLKSVSIDQVLEDIKLRNKAGLKRTALNLLLDT